MSYTPYADWNRLRLQQMGFDQSPVQGVNAGSSVYEDPNEMISQGPIQMPQQPSVNQYPQQPDIDIASIYSRYPQQTKMQEMFAQMAQQAPNRADYKPGRLESIAAAMEAFGGPATYWGGIPVGYKQDPNADEVMQNRLSRPYDEAALDYKMRIDPVRAAADDERMANVNQRQLADAQINRQIQQGTLNAREARDAEYARANLEREDVARQKLELANKALEIRDFVARKPNMRPAIGEDGTLYLYDSTNPTAQPMNTGINTGKLGDIQRNELGITRDAARINAQGQVELTNIGARTEGAIEVKKTVPGKNTAPVQRPPGQGRSITSVEKALRIQQAIATDPSIDPYIVKNNQGMPTGAVKKGSWYNHDEEAYNRARKVIEGIPSTTGGARAGAPSGTTDASIRERAIAELKQRGKVVNEQSIAAAIKLLGQ